MKGTLVTNNVSINWKKTSLSSPTVGYIIDVYIKFKCKLHLNLNVNDSAGLEAITAAILDLTADRPTELISLNPEISCRFDN